MLLYTDGSKLEDGRTGSGWVAYCVGNRVVRKVASGRCHLGSHAEVYDAELHAIQEALTALRDSIDTTPGVAYPCVDNQSALDTLACDASATEFSRAAVHVAADLSRSGWTIQGIWTPAHVGITGNEALDAEAKSGAAAAASPCKHTRATKTWMLAECKRQLRSRWAQELPDARPGLRLPAHLRGYQWVDTRALWRLYCAAHHPTGTWRGVRSPPNHAHVATASSPEAMLSSNADCSSAHASACRRRHRGASLGHMCWIPSTPRR
jgi:ribonuclease HI